MVSRLEGHDLSVMHKMVEGVLQSIVHLKFRQRKNVVESPGLGWQGQMGTLRFHPGPAMQGPNSYATKESAPPTGAPPAAVGGSLIG